MIMPNMSIMLTSAKVIISNLYVFWLGTLKMDLAQISLKPIFVGFGEGEQSHAPPEMKFLEYKMKYRLPFKCKEPS